MSNRKRHTADGRLLNARRHKGVGRPSKYQREYCDIVESLGRQGKSPAQMAAILNVDRASLYRWAADHDDFAQSLARAKTFEQAWWEDHGQKNLKAKHYQAQLWHKSMVARFRDDYTERTEVGMQIDLVELVREALARRDAKRIAGDTAKPVQATVIDGETEAK